MKSAIQLISNLPESGISIFSKMSALAAKHEAINLSQGFPDFQVDSELIRLVNHSMEKGKNQYAPSTGLFNLKDQIKRITNLQYSRIVEPEVEITITSGATEALFCAIKAVVREGDEVLIFEPSYDSYVPAVLMSGGKPVFYELKPPDYRINWDEINRLINNRTKAIIINTPHNPTGTILNSNDLDKLNQITENRNIFIISDEVYENITFDGLKHESINYYPSLYNRSLIISSLGKTFHTTGWKVGYCIAPDYLTEEFRKIHQYITFSTSTPFQDGFAGYISTFSHFRSVSELYEEKRNKFLALMKKSRFTPLKTSGTYFQLLDFSSISNEPDIDFADRITIEFGVASIPLSAFYHEKKDFKILRFCFAKKDQTLLEAAERLCRI
jgi:methionine aminotransferase